MDNHWVKLKEGKKERQISGPCKRIEKTIEHESDGDTSCNRCTRYSHQRIDTGTGGLENERSSGDHSNYNIIEIGQNTKKRPGHLKRLAVTQTSVENHQLTLT